VSKLHDFYQFIMESAHDMSIEWLDLREDGDSIYSKNATK
jgi:hypothetical protein